MLRATEFPPREEGRIYLTEGGSETEIMYKWGHELPHFAMFPLLDDEKAVEDMKGVWRRYLDVAEKHGLSALMNGLDYRASPDWGKLLGYSAGGLAEMQCRAIDFLTELRDEYTGRIERIVVSGIVGPRGDAYSLDRTITEAEAEDYHSVQLETLKKTDAEMAYAMTFNNVPEAVGVIRAARRIGIPLAMSFTLDSTSRLKSGPSLREAIETVEEQTDGSASFYAVNCSHPVEFEPALDGGSWEQRIRCIRPNASKMEKIALCRHGHLEGGNPRELGHQMGDIAERFPWMDIFGGSCGTDERHLEEIGKAALRARREAEDLFDDVPI